jgi:hypothetical protein
MRDRDAEDGHDRVADEFHDDAFVALDHELHLREVARQHVPQRLGVEELAQAGRSADVGEEDGWWTFRVSVPTEPSVMRRFSPRRRKLDKAVAAAGGWASEWQATGPGRPQGEAVMATAPGNEQRLRDVEVITPSVALPV